MQQHDIINVNKNYKGMLKPTICSFAADIEMPMHQITLKDGSSRDAFPRNEFSQGAFHAHMNSCRIAGKPLAAELDHVADLLCSVVKGQKNRTSDGWEIDGNA